MTEQIKFIIQSLNSNQGGELDALDGMTPLDAVVRILNNQLTSLMWIDEKVSIFHHAIVWWNFLLLLLVRYAYYWVCSFGSEVKLTPL
ncbi:hypothetical protein S83_037364 [Arachis hypogaea]